MPYINIATSIKVENKKEFLDEISTLISSLTNKSKSFVMSRLEDNCKIFFADDGPCCYLEIKSIGSMNSKTMIKPICDFLYEKLGIPINKIYVNFENISPNMWGWNGQTFG